MKSTPILSLIFHPREAVFRRLFDIRKACGTEIFSRLLRRTAICSDSLRSRNQDQTQIGLQPNWLKANLDANAATVAVVGPRPNHGSNDSAQESARWAGQDVDAILP
jgi:hypothetical protein